MCSEQNRLLGVGPEAARDAEEEARLLARGRGHPVERKRDIRAHRLALPVRERTVISAATRAGRPCGPWVRRQLRRRAGPDRDPAAVIASYPNAGLSAHLDRHASGRERPTGEAHIRPPDPHAVPLCAPDSGSAGKLEVALLL